jgi:hypothetical protein
MELIAASLVIALVLGLFVVSCLITVVVVSVTLACDKPDPHM